MRLAIASDHAGFRYKALLTTALTQLGHQVADFGTHSEDPVDYPDLVFPAAEAVADGSCDRGIVLGGSGNGEAMAANRLTGVRCAVSWNPESARLSRAHNDANMLAVGQRLISEADLHLIVQTWLDTPFEGGRHIRRIAKLDARAP